MIRSIEKLDQEKSFIENIRSLVESDWHEINQEIRLQLDTDVGLISNISNYIINSGGKRLRPLLVLLVAKASQVDDKNHTRILAAIMIELIHTATLLHDDVVDDSNNRRGSETVHQHFGNQSAILVGDFVYSRAFQVMVQIGQMRVMEIMADATNTIAEGEVLQLINCGNPDITEKQYLDVIYRKTGKLFEAGATIGAVLGNQSKLIESSLTDYGRNLGIAFQLIDDVLDYSSSFETIGKDVGDDLAEGKPTLPLIYALERCEPKEQIIIRQAIQSKNTQNIDQIIEYIKSSGALALSAEKAKSLSDQAIESLEPLPESEYKNGLIELAQFAMNRMY
jgi:octaprenyl-diphosphate synthase